MRFTDLLLLVIALTLVVGVVALIRQGRQRSTETEAMRTALYAIANIRYDLRRSEPTVIKFEPNVIKAIERLQRTAVDIQGMIELASRWAVATMPPEAIEDMLVPDDWVKSSKED